jgi:hypothetical protein
MRAKAYAPCFVALDGEELNMSPLSIRQPNAPWFESLTMTPFLSFSPSQIAEFHHND